MYQEPFVRIARWRTEGEISSRTWVQLCKPIGRMQ